MVAAAQDQISNEFANAWGEERGPATLTIYNNTSDIPDGYWVVTIVDDPDQMSYFGYHVNNLPVSQAILFADTIINYGCPILYDPADPTFFTVSSLLCHELLEMIVDPCVNEWWDGPATTINGTFYPIVSYSAEICDPVYFDVYTKNIDGYNVNVSNFVYPDWRDIYAGTSAQFDQMEVLSSPFSMDYGGYMLVRNSDYTTEGYIYGAKFPTNFQEFTRKNGRNASRTHHLSRTNLKPVSGNPRNIQNPLDKKT